jgi:type IV pilus assembly protein PilY1
MPSRPSNLGRGLARAALAATCLLPAASVLAADIDIYGGPDAAGGAPNVLFFLDNSANWSNQSQAWTPGSSWDKCKNLSAAQVTDCKNAIEEVFYVGKPASEKRPWEGGFKEWNSSKSPTQGQVELRAIRFVLKQLVCNNSPTKLNVNIGLSMFSPDKGSALSTGHPSGFIYQAIKPSDATNCTQLLAKLDAIDANITSPSTKAPQDANYGTALYEIFKYFGGFTSPTLAGSDVAGSPQGATGYGPDRFSVKQTLDDPDAFTSAAKTTYLSPLDNNANCGNNYLIFVGNTYPKAEPNNGGPVRFSGINYTPPALSPVTSDPNRFADEWTYFLANTDIHDADGVQRLFSYVVNVYNDKPDADQTKLTKSMAAVGGVGGPGYIEVGGDLLKLVTAFSDILSNIAAVDSVFAATTLPVSTTTQGTFLNQIFVGLFRPDANASPRWVGNLKQYQLAMVNGTLSLVDQTGVPAVGADSGLFTATAQSFWTTPSVYFAQQPAGTPASASDSPDGNLVDKGGAAQRLREANLQSSVARNVLTLSGGALVPFTAATAGGMSATEVAWVRGENNVAAGPGMEAMVGSYDNAGVPTPLGSTGVRHSVHGDVLHSRPVALNYGSGGVVVYYGTNDGFFRAVDGQKVGGGGELWSFIPPDLFPLQKRLRDGTPELHLPETDSAGATVAAPAGKAAKSYGMDGPIGVFALYSDANTVDKAWIFATMRRGGKNVYAFDVSNKNAPSFKWAIQGGAGAYSALAQTWSMPKAVVTKSDDATRPPILIMGGGYDPDEDQNGSSGIGNRIYIVNGNDGTLIHEMTTQYSVPSDVSVVDVNGDGDPDRAYVADVRGGVYRVDFPGPDKDLTEPANWAATVAVKIGEAGGKVFYAPDVVVTKYFAAVLVGTGDREKPLLNTTSDKFVMFKDEVPTWPIAGRTYPLTVADLTRVAKIDNATMQWTDAAGVVNDAEGCYLELATNGEKVVNAPLTIAGATYFGTNRPTPANAKICTADLGQAHAYKFPLFCGMPAPPSPIIGGGLPPSPVGGIVTIDINGTPTQVPFLIGGTGPGTFDVAEPKPPIPPIRTRQHWRIDNDR